MARPTNEERLRKIHAEALEEFDSIQSAVRDERSRCLRDRRFAKIEGAQWEGRLGDQFENKPKFEFNKIGQALDRIETDFRSNRIDVAFESKDGSPSNKLADACASLYRADVQDSCAEEAFDSAFVDLSTGGVGAWRLRATYEDEDSEDGQDDADESRPQRIRFEPIHDADSSVFFDLNAKTQDKSDARFCFVITSMTRREYERRYDDDPTTWPKDVQQTEFDWSTDDAIFVAEYYRVDDAGETFRLFEGLTGETVEHNEADFEADEELERRLQATGFVEVGQRKSRPRRIHKYILSGGGVLEDCGVIAGRQIPVVIAYGSRAVIDNTERCSGHVRRAMDPQRILNLMLSKLGEICALAPAEKPILTAGQILGHEHTWAEDNLKNYPYRLLNPIVDPATGQMLPTQGPIGNVKSPDVPPVLAALIQLAESGLQDMLGNPKETEKMVSHVAGKTVELLNQTLDKRSEPYIANMGKAIKRSGQIWLSMAKELYTQPGRKMKGVGRLKERSQIELRRPVVDPVTRAVAYENDLTRASFDVAVSIGPSNATQRQAALKAATGMMAATQDPKAQSILALVAMMHMDGENVDGVRKWARRELVNLGVLEPTAEEAQQIAAAAQNAQPDPQAAYLAAEAEKSKAQAQQALADVELTAAKTDKTKADTFAVLADVDVSRQAAVIDAAKSLDEMFNDQAPSLGSNTGAAPEGPGSDL